MWVDVRSFVLLPVCEDMVPKGNRDVSDVSCGNVF